MAKDKNQKSKIIGIRLPEMVARHVKAEAGRRGIQLNQLFMQMWEMYEKKGGEMKLEKKTGKDLARAD